MAGNSFGTLFRLTTFGESHGTAIGGVIDGCPAGLQLDLDDVQHQLSRRRPGQSSITTERKEEDRLEILSGVFEGKTTGTPLAFMIRNKDHRSEDYDQLSKVFRPSHADYTWKEKFGIRDHRGGGRASARETAARVAAGAIAAQFLAQAGILSQAYVSAVHNVSLPDGAILEMDSIDDFESRCPHPPTHQKILTAIEKAKEEKDSLGGTIECRIAGLPVGLGEPVFDKLHAVLGHAFFSINAVKAVEFGSGVLAARMKGSEHNDEFEGDGKTIRTKTNFSGGVQGGLSNGEMLEARITFKPVATIGKTQNTVDESGHAVELSASGRHDPCVLPRAVPIVEAMANLVVLDMLLLSANNRLSL
jgi:chorismate synthase